MIKDYYKILDVKITSTQEEIKNSFRKLAIFWHPDRNSNPIALQKMQEINVAYEILSNLNRKETYDRIYKDYFNLNFDITVFTEKENNYNYSEKQKSETTKQKEEDFRKKYEKEISDLNNWVRNINFSLSSFDRFLDKSLAKADKPIENFVYYFPIVLGIIFLIIILLLNLSK